jgi:hypothetical protein
LLTTNLPPPTQAMEGNAPTDSKALTKLERVAIEMEEAATCVPRPSRRLTTRLTTLRHRSGLTAVSLDRWHGCRRRVWEWACT